MRSYRLKYTGIRVKDMDESLQFYTGVLGMEVVDKREPTPPTKGEVVTLRSPGGDQLLELNWYAEGSRFGLPYVYGEELEHLSFEVADHAPDSIGDGPERHRPRSEEEHEESRRASSREVVAVRRPVVGVCEGVRRVILVEHRDPRGGERRDIERARGEPGILRQYGNVRRSGDVVKQRGHPEP